MLFLASVDWALPVMATVMLPLSRRNGSSLTSSSVSPELEMATKTSSGRHHAEVAVEGLARMHEERRRTGAGERGGDLLADDAGLAHAADDDAARRREDGGDRGRETAVERQTQTAYRGGLDLEDLVGDGGEVWLGKVGHGWARIWCLDS